MRECEPFCECFVHVTKQHVGAIYKVLDNELKGENFGAERLHRYGK